MATDDLPIRLGLKENLGQFALLVLVNAFVGGMAGMERAIFPQFAAAKFQVALQTAMLSFITAFGIGKAITNYFTGRLANRFGRRNLLLAGWGAALPVPLLLISATAWVQVVFANILLGISQGLAWSSTVVMKIDLVGEKDRGLAMGLNEFAGYLAVGVVAYLTAYIAEHYGVTPYPFYLGIGISLTGLLVSLLWVKDTRAFVRREAGQSTVENLSHVFWETTWRNPNLSAVTQAGLVNNLNDGMIWGLLPALLMQQNYSDQSIGFVAAVYPTVWGIGQLFTGKMSDLYSKKAMLFWGMFLQGIAIVVMPYTHTLGLLTALAAFLGLGTALVYPTFLAAVAQATHPRQRAESIGVFRLWRDLGYAFGAIVSGVAADFFGIKSAVVLIGCMTLLSAWIIRRRMQE